jgi:transcriptional regulator with XRE-family HTH domain
MADYARGDEFRRLREAKHLSQMQAGFEIGVTDKTIRAWEKGSGIEWEHAVAAARVYGVDPESLVRREGQEGEEAPDLMHTLNGDGPDRLARIEAAVEETRKLARRLAAAQGLDPDASAPEEAEQAAADVARATRASRSGSAGTRGAKRGRAG